MSIVSTSINLSLNAKPKFADRIFFADVPIKIDSPFEINNNNNNNNNNN